VTDRVRGNPNSTDVVGPSPPLLSRHTSINAISGGTSLLVAALESSRMVSVELKPTSSLSHIPWGPTQVSLLPIHDPLVTPDHWVTFSQGNSHMTVPTGPPRT
jgi:hypothetical protein